MCHVKQIAVCALAAALFSPVRSLAQDGQLGVTLYSASDSDPAAATSGSADAPKGPEDAYGPPWGTAAMSGELGLFWGAFIPSSKHELYDSDDPQITWHKLEKVTPELGLRAAFFPLRVLGVEAEVALMPSQTRDTNDSVTLWALRGHLILQAPTKTLVPFVLAGGGALGLSSSKKVLGSDVDPSAHAGVGVKAYVSKDLALRLEGRGNLSQGYGPDKRVVHWEGLLGLSVVLGRPEVPPPPPDTDGDGVPDARDQCPQQAGVPPLGCPPPPPDGDGDGIPDESDKCPSTVGVASTDPEKNGCPPDTDGDGVPDANDKCPGVVGDGPDGCLQDTDGDGIPNKTDKCPDQPETRNGFEDEDGCPDELPRAVQRFTGAIQGIAFDSGKATIKPTSFATLDAAASVLNEYPALRVEISGHTDNTGTPERNMQLSQGRADAVKQYLVGRGIAADRIETRGAGPNEPVADNATPDGRSKNRRIEFKLIQSPAPETAPASGAAPQPGTATPTPGGGIPAPAAPQPGAAAPGAAQPGAAAPAPAAPQPRAAAPGASQPGAAAPAPAAPQPRAAAPAPGASQPGAAAPAPAAPQPRAATPAPGASQPGATAPAPATPQPGAAAPGGSTPAPAAPQPGAAGPAPAPATPAPSAR